MKVRTPNVEEMENVIAVQPHIRAEANALQSDSFWGKN